MSKHTPGPWWFAGMEIGTVPNMDIKVARVSGANLEEARANGRLMAAAPKLLAALEGMIGACALGGAYLVSCRRDAELAIAQAKGKQSKKCCEPTADEGVLLETGEYTPEELWGGRRPTCPKCIGDEKP